MFSLEKDIDIDTQTNHFERMLVCVFIPLVLLLGVQSCAKKKEPKKTSEVGALNNSQENVSTKGSKDSSEVEIEGPLEYGIGVGLQIETEDTLYRLLTTKETEFMNIRFVVGSESVVYRFGNIHRVRGIIFTPETRDRIGLKPNVFLKVIYIKDLLKQKDDKD